MFTNVTPTGIQQNVFYQTRPWLQMTTHLLKILCTRGTTMLICKTMHTTGREISFCLFAKIFRKKIMQNIKYKYKKDKNNICL